MATHPQGIVIEIVGVEESKRGRSCERHDVCGDHLGLDAVLRLRQVQIVQENGREEKAVAAYLVTEGVDSCRVGFLPRQCLKHAEKFDGKLAQITEFLAESNSPHCRRLSHRNRGIVRAMIITGGPSDFCLNFLPTVEKLNSALHSASETLLSANAADSIVGFVGDEHDKKKFQRKDRVPPVAPTCRKIASCVWKSKSKVENNSIFN
jgi:hypothetical protein